MFDLDDIRSYVMVAETGGFSRAATRLGLSKSMVSRRIVRLEKELGAQLLNRTTRGVVVTQAGQTFRAYAERALGELETAREAVGNEDEALTGSMRIAAPLSFGIEHLAPVLAELALAHPRLQIYTSYSNRRVDLLAERFDVAIRVGSLPDSSLVARRIATMLGAVTASPAYIARRGAPTSLAELADHELLTEDAPTWPFRDGKREVNVPVHGRFRSDSGEALLAACIAGAGIAMLPTFLTGARIAKGELVPLLTQHPIPEFGMYVVRPPPANHMTRKVRVLTETLVEKFGGEPYWDACYQHRKANKTAAAAAPL
jgi:DNA-binding transcriptional LysR family regulator